MKVKCEFELDWVDDDQTIDSAIEERIAGAIADRMPENIFEKIEKQASNQMAERVDATIDIILDRFMNKEVMVTDRWGDIQEKYESVNELLKSKFDNFVSQKVDQNGHPVKGCSYGKEYTRIDHLIDERIRVATEAFVKKIMDGIQSQLKKHLNEEVRKGTAEAIKKAMNLDAILSNKT
jgi:macrodomain Ter protein organizer (MatP/YcbG family)